MALKALYFRGVETKRFQNHGVKLRDVNLRRPTPEFRRGAGEPTAARRRADAVPY